MSRKQRQKVNSGAEKLLNIITIVVCIFVFVCVVNFIVQMSDEAKYGVNQTYSEDLMINTLTSKSYSQLLDHVISNQVTDPTYQDAEYWKLGKYFEETSYANAYRAVGDESKASQHEAKAKEYGDQVTTLTAAKQEITAQLEP